MSVDVEHAKAHFASLEAEELVRLIEAGTLTPAARGLAEDELLARGVSHRPSPHDPESGQVASENAAAQGHSHHRSWLYWIVMLPICAIVARVFGQVFGVLGLFLMLSLLLVSERDERRKIRWGPSIEWLLLLWFGLLGSVLQGALLLAEGISVPVPLFLIGVVAYFLIWFSKRRRPGAERERDR